MKKIFTLISMAFVAMSVNAQETTQVFSVGNGDFNTTDKAQGIQVKVGDKACANVVILSSPYPDNEYKFDSYDATTQTNVYDKTKPIAPWSLEGDASSNTSIAAIQEGFTSYLKGKGNPFITENFSWEYDEEKKQNKLVDVNSTNTVFTPGCGTLPVRGEYIKVTPIVAGTFTIGIRIPKGNHPFYVVDASTASAGYTLLPNTSMTVKGYFNNNAWDGVKDGDTPLPLPLNLEMPENYIIQQQTATSPVGARNIGQIFLGTVAFPVEAGKTYYIFSPKSQVDFYGVAYTYDQAAFEAADPLPTPEVPTSIEAVKNVQPKADCAIYNLAGQKVDKSFKGIVLKNGKKMIQK